MYAKIVENLNIGYILALFQSSTPGVFMGGSPGDVSENHVTSERRKKGWGMSCDVGEATEGLENEL